MKEFKYTITDPEGIHARPAGLFVKAGAAYPCAVTIIKVGQEADAKRILGVMGLGVKQGQEITIRTDGDQEEEACTELEKFFKENL
ncbi:MAG: HPr family phosphocarrier protein [Lachnospiraceae bacterium]|nr:HPr family phosphocarrier protein [Lachnospiraceae bacterium]